MNGWTAPLCRYIHLPTQILWWDTIEWYMLIMGYVMGLIYSPLVWLTVPLMPFTLFPLKRSANRGAVGQLMYLVGLKSIKGYPEPVSHLFWE